MITVIKQDPLGKAKIQYEGEIIGLLDHGVVIQAFWTQSDKDLVYTHFTTGDCFIEYYYTERWFNIFDIASADGVRKGWYCNITEPAIITADRIEQIDLYIDVWITPTGDPLILDEDEFASATILSDRQRYGAINGLKELLHMLHTRQEIFASVAD